MLHFQLLLVLASLVCLVLSASHLGSETQARKPCRTQRRKQHWQPVGEPLGMKMVRLSNQRQWSSVLDIYEQRTRDMKDVRDHNVAMRAYFASKQVEKALKVFTRIIQQKIGTAHSVSILLSGLINNGEPRRAVSKFQEHRAVCDQSACNTALHAMFMAGDVQQAEALFAEMQNSSTQGGEKTPAANDATFATMMSGYNMLGLFCKSIGLFERSYLSEGLRGAIEQHVGNNVVQALLESSEWQQLRNGVAKGWWSRNLLTGNTLATMHDTARLVKNEQWIIDAFRQLRDLFSDDRPYGTAVKAMIALNQEDEAERIVNDMIDPQQSKWPTPSEQLLANFVQALYQHKKYQTVSRWFQSHKHNVHVANHQACWNIAIKNWFAQKGQQDQARALYGEMKQSGMINQATVSTIMKGLRDLNQHQAAVKIYLEHSGHVQLDERCQNELRLSQRALGQAVMPEKVNPVESELWKVVLAMEEMIEAGKYRQALSMFGKRHKAYPRECSTFLWSTALHAQLLDNKLSVCELFARYAAQCSDYVKLPASEKLDLHGLTRWMAISAVHWHVSNRVQRFPAVVRVNIGAGSHSTKAPVLGSTLHQALQKGWLNSATYNCTSVDDVSVANIALHFVRSAS